MQIIVHPLNGIYSQINGVSRRHKYMQGWSGMWLLDVDTQCTEKILITKYEEF